MQLGAGEIGAHRLCVQLAWVPVPVTLHALRLCGNGCEQTWQCPPHAPRLAVLLPHALAIRLEATRRDEPERITDRGIHYQSCYDIGGGQRWSNSVSAASERVLGWSTGAHGLRHAYAQERMSELQYTLSRDRALETVSQEMGHFRPEITETYLR